MSERVAGRLMALGYTGASMQRIAELLIRERAVLVDIRHSPFSRAPLWQRTSFVEKLGAYPKQYPLDEASEAQGPTVLAMAALGNAEVAQAIKQYGAISGRYLHVKEFGNTNYKGTKGQGVILADPHAGLLRLQREVWGRGFNVVLMCACVEYKTCHRKDVANYIKDQLGYEVEQVEPKVIESETAARRGKGGVRMRSLPEDHDLTDLRGTDLRQLSMFNEREVGSPSKRRMD